MTKKEKTLGRVKLNCKRCTAAFSTHSSNRDVCHTCKPKCAEVHDFTELMTSRKKKEKQESLENN